MAFMGDGIMSGKNDDNISPYLRRPIRSLMEYLREAAQRRKQQQDQEDPAETTEPGRRTTSEDDGAPKDGD